MWLARQKLTLKIDIPSTIFQKTVLALFLYAYITYNNKCHFHYRGERGCRGRAKLATLAVYNEDESNDLSDLGIGTSSASGKSSQSEDYDNNSVLVSFMKNKLFIKRVQDCIQANYKRQVLNRIDA